MRTNLLALILGLVVGGGYVFTHTPKIRATGPHVRHHGYLLNKAAIRKAKLFTVLISGEGFGGISRGTGILLDSTHILTCAHVALHHNDETFVYFYPGYMTARAHTVYVDKSKDLAIMELDVTVSGAPVPVFQEAYFDGEPITIMGNILGSMKWFVGYGIISGGNGIYLYTDGLVKGGDSGGPWINDSGEVVALSDWGLQEKGKDLGVSGGISAHTINDFLKGWKSPAFMLEQRFLEGLFGVDRSAPTAGGH